jgi:hypothetical protein
MKRCLICAGLFAAILWCDLGAVTQAQTVVPPINPNALTPQQRQTLRQMMRLRRHHRHRHKIPATTVTPPTSMIATPMLNPMAVNPMMVTQTPFRRRGHHHRHHRYQMIMAQMMMQQMMMNQMLQNQNAVNSLPPPVVAKTPAAKNGKALAARRKKQIIAQLQQVSF